MVSPPPAGIRLRGGVRPQAGEAQRGPRVSPQVPHGELPPLHRGRPGSAGALVPRGPRGGVHAAAGIQGKQHVFVYLMSDAKDLQRHTVILWGSLGHFCFHICNDDMLLVLLVR